MIWMVGIGMVVLISSLILSTSTALNYLKFSPNSTDHVSKLREMSRQQYLMKREKKEVKLLEKSLQDEEYLFEGVRVSKEEEQRHELQKRILEMARNENRYDYSDAG